MSRRHRQGAVPDLLIAEDLMRKLNKTFLGEEFIVDWISSDTDELEVEVLVESYYFFILWCMKRKIFRVSFIMLDGDGPRDTTFEPGIIHEMPTYPELVFFIRGV